MKDFELESEKWWEVVEEYLTKELQTNLAQHGTDENIIRYKLEAYQKNFLEFIYGSSISIEVLSHDEENKAGPDGTSQEEEMQTEEPQDLRSGIV